jgi:tetratricopeptide (TPR) repeat protein/tRNA A-37 threonylcarbamoyl transferase component Bud32
MDQLDQSIRNMWAKESTSQPGAPRPSRPSEFAGYTDFEIIGAGGMGQILRATDPVIGREIAIKTLHPKLLSNKSTLRRFQREAQITGRLEHPNIVPVHEARQTPDGTHFFSMKLVGGQSLAELLGDLRVLSDQGNSAHDGTRLLPEFIKVCEAMEFAHSRGVIHRDLKPANIMIGSFGEVLVMDWGLAKSDLSHPGETSVELRTIDSEEERGRSDLDAIPIDSFQTRDGSIMGTLAYMPPEQAEGKIQEIDQQSDLYSLGAILYELLTLRPPRRGKQDVYILSQILHGELPPPRECNPKAFVPRDLEAVVLKAMAQDKADRYVNVSEMKADLQAFLQGRTLEAATYNPLQWMVKWIARNRKMCIGATGVLLIATGFFGFQRWSLFASNRDRALEWIEEVGDVAVLTEATSVIGSDGRERRDTPEESRRREVAIETYAAAANALDRALEVFPGNEAVRKRRREIGIKIGMMALGGRDYLFARQSFRQLRNHGLSEEEVVRWIRKVEKVRTGVLDWRKDRLVALLARLSEGLKNTDDEEATDFLLEDCVAEARAYRDPQTVEILGEDLKVLTEMARKAREAGGTVTWTQAQRDRAKFICRVLGRLGLPACVKPLGEWMLEIASTKESHRDDELVREAGIALCNTRNERAHSYLVKARPRMGFNSTLWKQIERVFVRVPEPGGRSQPETAKAYTNRGLARQAKKDLDGAIQNYSQAIQIDPKWVDAYINRGNARKYKGDLTGAIQDYDQAIALDPKSTTAYLNRGNARKYLGDLDGAIQDYDQAIALDPKYAKAYNNRGNARQAKGDLHGAIEDFNKATEIDPKDPKSYSNRGNARRAKGDLDRAIEDYSKAIELDPKYAEAYGNRGNARRAKGDLAGAIEDYDRSIEISPRSARLYGNRGNARQAKGDLDGAIQDYDQAIEISPGLAPLYLNRGSVWQAKRNLDEAIQDYSRAIRLKPQFALPYAYRGFALQVSGDLPGAIADYEKALEIAPARWSHRERVVGQLAKARKKLTSE